MDPIRKRKDIEAIKAALVSQPRNFALFVVGIHFGLRGSDLLSLRWDDVLTPACAILDHIEVREQKTGKQRRIAVQSNARTALALLQSRMQPDRADYVFQSRKGGRLTIQRLHQLVVEWTGDAGLRGNFGSHTLRKTMGYALRQAGVGIETVMKIYGHSSQAVTMRYLGIDQDETDEARLKLNL